MLKLEGLDKFILEVIPLTSSYFVNKELGLEQYFLLQPDFKLNFLKAVQGFSGSRANTLYMYNLDYSSLIYISEIMEDFVFKLGIHRTTLNKCLKGETYLNKYLFSETPVLGAKYSNLSAEEVSNILDIDRAEQLKTRGRRVIITSIKDRNEVMEFDSINSCISFLNTISDSNKTSLYRHINSKEPYQGYICELEGNVKTSLIGKSIRVKITHIPTNTVNIYPSLRKAALSFAPGCKTSGQTLASYINNGKLFNNEYRIEIIDVKEKKK